MVRRAIFHNLRDDLLNSNKIIVLFGARQTGKTTLSNVILNSFEGNVLRINADELKYIEVLASRDSDKFGLLFDGYDLVFIDEAQRIPDIGINLKIIYDSFPGLKILVTGSSSFDLAGKISEPLTGRTLTYTLYPLSLIEIRTEKNVFEIKANLETFMVYGMYPGILTLTSAKAKEKHLTELSTAYLFKDVFELSTIRNPSVLRNLLRLLALQIGSEVSIPELSKNLNISQDTVNNYIDLLEKAFIVFRLGGYSRNLRKEVTKRSKIYFWDTGIRNSVINNFSGFDYRNDKGALWENFVISERLKYQSYNYINASPYFWRTYTGAEVDYIEEHNGKVRAFEIKLKNKKTSAPKTWTENYGEDYFTINPDNFHEFLI
ncbi:MAG: ATP-binding protein [Lentimicrobium sp.]|nr:ATP-binding protein [Lentimicrobium sp.]